MHNKELQVKVDRLGVGLFKAGQGGSTDRGITLLWAIHTIRSGPLLLYLGTTNLKYELISENQPSHLH